MTTGSGDRLSPQRENQSVRKAAALLRAAAEAGGAATVSALARTAGLPRATALRMIESLVSERLLARLPDDRIVIGPGLQSLARAGDLTELVVDAAQGPLDQLAQQTAETITLTVARPDGSLAVVRQVDGRYMLGLANWVGRPFPLHASSAGKLALAHGPADRVEALLRTPLPRLALRTITDPQVFRDELAAIRERGWSEIEDELEDGLGAISIGVGFEGTFVASINVSGPSARLDAAARRAVLPALSRACRRTEQNLGGRGSRAGR